MGETGESSTPAKTGGKTMSGRDEHDEMKEPEWMVKKREYEQRMARAKNVKLRTLCTICGEKAKLPCPCGTAQYCTVACQKIDWRDRGHRKACKKIRDERAAEAARAEAPTPPPRDVVYGPAPRSGADEVRARIAAEHEAARARREANPEPEPLSARQGSRCPICYEDWDVNFHSEMTPCCARTICKRCNEKHGRVPCALCRAPYPKSKAAYVAGIRRHAENEVPDAILYLGHFYRDGAYGLVKSEKKAAKLYKRAVELGNVDAMNALGTQYGLGLGVKMDPNKARQLYRMAVDRGDAAAQCNLAMGLRKEGKYDEAMRLFLLSAKQGYANAIYGIAFMYVNGMVGGRPDYVAARPWLERAAAGTDVAVVEKARIVLAQLDARGL